MSAQERHFCILMAVVTMIAGKQYQDVRPLEMFWGVVSMVYVALYFAALIKEATT